MTLVCFAVKEEARSFRRHTGAAPQISILLTGMGRANAERAVLDSLASRRPARVLTCGFAGGLRPGLPRGATLFETDPATGLEPALLAAGARPARFHGSETVVSSVAQKRALWEATQADVVEMESEFIRRICRQKAIPSGTVRVVLDAAEDALPLDFNQLMTAGMRLDARKLAVALARSPGKIAGLLRLQRQSRAAAECLGRLLARVLLGS